MGVKVSVGVGLTVGVEVGALTVEVEVGLVGLTAGVNVGVIDDTGMGVIVLVAVGVIVAVLSGGGGQVCSRTVTCWQFVPAHTFNVSKVLLGARHSTTCLSFSVSTVPQPGPVLAPADTEAVGVRIVKVAPAGIINKACAAVSIQNWHTSEASGPVTGMPGVSVVSGVDVAVAVSVIASVLVGIVVIVGLTGGGRAVAVGEAG